ncbi:MAG TPA: haloacid dehalogenase [Chloroflexota bacterium]|nr:haloacid dehalogenase [Chloroflexota bacterium]
MAEGPLAASLAAIEAAARQELEAKHAAREQALVESRALVRLCANAIRAVHREEFDRAAEMLAEAQGISSRLAEALREHQDLYWAGYVQDAQKELVEACVTFRAVRGEPLPLPTELGVAAPAFLNGLGEAVGELRRYLLDRLRRGAIGGCEALLAIMDDIYSLLITLDYPDALTGGLRRTTDNVRGILERTRGELTLALSHHELQNALQQLAARLP